MKKLIISCLFGLLLGCPFIPTKVHAAVVVAPKASYVLAYTTTISTISAGPGAIYELTLSSGAASEFVTLYDTVTTGVAAITGPNQTGSNTKARILYGSTTANTQYRFDPPLEFLNGIQIGDSASTGMVTVTYELGRGLSGQ